MRADYPIHHSNQLITLYHQFECAGAIFSTIETVSALNKNKYAVNIMAKGLANSLFNCANANSNNNTDLNSSYDFDSESSHLQNPSLHILSFSNLAGNHRSLFPYHRTFAKRTNSNNKEIDYNTWKISLETVVPKNSNPEHMGERTEFYSNKNVRGLGSKNSSNSNIDIDTNSKRLSGKFTEISSIFSSTFSLSGNKNKSNSSIKLDDDEKFHLKRYNSFEELTKLENKNKNDTSITSISKTNLVDFSDSGMLKSQKEIRNGELNSRNGFKIPTKQDKIIEIEKNKLLKPRKGSLCSYNSFDNDDENDGDGSDFDSQCSDDSEKKHDDNYTGNKSTSESYGK